MCKTVRGRTLGFPALCAISLLLILTACGAPATPVTIQTSTVVPPTAAATIFLPTETNTAAPPATTVPPTPTATATLEPELAVCSPLQGIAISELSQPDLLKTLFEMPRPGVDEGHHGVDFAYWSRGERTTMRGHPIQAALSGRVAGIVPNRQPYGYAVIVETRLDSLPQKALQALHLPAPAPTVIPAPNLLCPAGAVEGIWENAPDQSLYLLYAHMNEPPPVEVDQTVACGETIGAAGTTGRSVNDHLHLETRVGPSGAAFPIMVHYDNAATEAEMRAYCTWRVSGLFQLVDPLILFSLQP